MNVVQINELTELTEQNWGRLNEKIYPASDLDFTVIEVNGPVVYGEGKGISYEELINEAIKNRQVTTDIIVDGEIVGKLVVHENLNAIVNETRKNLRISIYMLLAFLLLIFIGYFFLAKF
jgi:pyruvate formate-lyase activating enzyme-like uncharacterized protein